MKRALLIAGGLMLMSAPLHAYVSGTMMSRNLHGPKAAATTTTVSDGEATSDPVATDPTIGVIDVKPEKHIGPNDECQPGHPVPEPGTMVITSMGLLAAAAFRRKKSTQKPE
jgi:hypothetical protein